MTRYDSLRTYVDAERRARDARVETLDAVHSTGRVLAIAAVLLFLFNSAGLRTWSSDLPGNVTTDRLASEAENWHDLMTRVGLAAPQLWLEENLANWRELSWSDLTLTDTAIADASTTDDNLGVEGVVDESFEAEQSFPDDELSPISEASADLD